MIRKKDYLVGSDVLGADLALSAKVAADDAVGHGHGHGGHGHGGGGFRGGWRGGPVDFWPYPEFAEEDLVVVEPNVEDLDEETLRNLLEKKTGKRA
jgi:hypothetical protein